LSIRFGKSSRVGGPALSGEEEATPWQISISSSGTER
jgi:hypothetical protein